MSDVTVDERAPESDEQPDGEPEQQTMAAPLELPEYHGRVPVSMLTKVTGAGGRVTRSHDMGERVVFLVEGHLEDAGHKQRKKEGLTYVERFVADDVVELGPEGFDLLIGKRQEYRLADDARSGRRSLFGDGPQLITPRVVWADENGYVLDAAALAALRGDPVPESDEERDARLEAEEDAARAAEAGEDMEALTEVLAPKWLRDAANGDTGGYDQLTVAQISSSLAYIDSVDDVQALLHYETVSKNRKGVRRMFEVRLDELAEPGF